jgi:hypothetical protein
MTEQKRLLTRSAIKPALFIMVLGMLAATYLHWPALTEENVYRSDIRQAPHWAAYHTTSFQDDDWLVEYARYNESPVQNVIYFVGTYFVDMVPLSKILAVVSYGAAAALFFLVGNALYGVQGGLLAGIFFTFLPDQFEFSAGFFSKFWMNPLLLLTIFALETKRWRWLLFLLPFGALAYPIAAVLMGGIAGVYMLLLIPTDRASAKEVFSHLSVASIVSLAILLIKYASPPEFIGPMTSGAELRAMPEMLSGGLLGSSPYIPIPSVWSEIAKQVVHPFVLGAGALYAIVLRKKLGWSTAWTAVLVASIVFYIYADWFFIKLYIPNRYTRHSLAVLLILWNARNLDAVLRMVSRRALRYAVLAGVLAAGAWFHRGTFEFGEDTDNRTRYAAMNDFISTLPDDVLIAGPPRYMDDVPIQARRSVLVNFKLSHPWRKYFYEEVRRRTLDTYQAIYARDVATINRLHEKYGVDYLVTAKSLYEPRLMYGGLIYVRPYSLLIDYMAKADGIPVLASPPPESVVYNSQGFVVLKLPME